MTHPYPLLHGTVYAVSGIPDVDTRIEALPRHKRQWPFIGSIVHYLDERRSGGVLPELPRNIAMPYVMGSKTNYPPLAGPYGGMLGMRYDPVYTNFRPEGLHVAPEVVKGSKFKDPLLAIKPTDKLELAEGGGVEVTSERLDLRRSLLGQFDRGRRRGFDSLCCTSTFDQQQQMAFSLLSSGTMHAALDYAREPMSVREAYGMTLFGQSCLAGRRLIEAGARFVTVIWDAYGLNAGSWDTHWNHYGRLKDFLLPVFDQTFSTLIRDLDERGMLDETLVLVISEHGRTPQIDSKPKGAGRGHWSPWRIPRFMQAAAWDAAKSCRSNRCPGGRSLRSLPSRRKMFWRPRSICWELIQTQPSPTPKAVRCRSRGRGVLRKRELLG